MYEFAKEKIRTYYTLPLTQKKFPDFSQEKRLKNILIFLKNLINNYYLLRLYYMYNYIFYFLNIHYMRGELQEI